MTRPLRWRRPPKHVLVAIGGCLAVIALLAAAFLVPASSPANRPVIGSLPTAPPTSPTPALPPVADDAAQPPADLPSDATVIGSTSPGRRDRNVVTARGPRPDGLTAAPAVNPLPVPFSPDYITPLSPIIEIGPSGALAEALTLTVPLDRVMTPSKEQVLLVAVNHSHTADGWQLRPASLTADGRNLRFVAHELSWFQAVVGNVGGMFADFARNVADGASSGIFDLEPPQQPSCAREDEAREGYTVDWSVAQTGDDHAAMWCFGIEGGKRVLKVTNAREYPLSASPVGLQVISWGNNSGDLQQIYRMGHDIILPGDTATFAVTVEPGQEVSLNLRLDNGALGFRVAQVFLDAAVILLTKGKLLSSGSAVQLPFELLSGSQCLAAIDRFDAGDILSACFNEARLSAVFGWRAAILAPVMLTYGTVDAGNALAAALFDRGQQRDQYDLVIRRQAVDPLTLLALDWYRHSTSLLIRADGTGIYNTRAYNPCGELPDCRFHALLRLEDAGNRSTPTLRVTFVEAGYQDYDGNPISLTPEQAAVLEPSYPVAGETGRLVYDADSGTMTLFYDGRLTGRNERPEVFCSTQLTKPGQGGDCGA